MIEYEIKLTDYSPSNLSETNELSNFYVFFGYLHSKCSIIKHKTFYIYRFWSAHLNKQQFNFNLVFWENLCGWVTLLWEILKFSTILLFYTTNIVLGHTNCVLGRFIFLSFVPVFLCLCVCLYMCFIFFSHLKFFL